MTQRTFQSLDGPVHIGDAEPFHNEAFGYTLYEEIMDPKNPEGPNAIVMHVPANTLSKAWLLKEHNYSETIELLQGYGWLVINRADDCEWEVVDLTPEDPTGKNVVVNRSDIFCVVAGGEDTVVLSRPSKEFDISFEMGVTGSPKEAMSRHILNLAQK